MNLSEHTPRFEFKFLPRGRTAEEILHLVRTHPAAFREAFPPRRVNSIYLDTPALDDYANHVNGLADRSKARVRWYGVFDGPLRKPVLEFKIKRGWASWKESHPLADFESPRHFLRYLRTRHDGWEWPAPVRPRMTGRTPAVGNSYRRHYYVTATGSIRLTLDYELAFQPVQNGSSVAVEFDEAPDQIIELKFLPAQTDFAQRIAEQFPFHLTRCSKYVLGIQLTGAA